MKEVKLNIVASDTEGKPVNVNLRTGEAERYFYPKPLSVKGNLETVERWLLNPGKFSALKVENAVLFLSAEKMAAILELNPKDELAGSVSGTAQLSKEFQAFKLNLGNREGRFDRMNLVQLLRMNRAYFQSVEEHGKLVSDLMGLEVDVHGKIVDKNDLRGNRASGYSQIAKGNVPLDFTLNIPIFKGAAAQRISVNIMYDVLGQDIIFWMESVEAQEAVLNYVNEMLDKIEDQYTEAGIMVVRD